MPTQTVKLAGSGLTFVNTYDSTVSSAYISAIIAAENFFQESFSNNVTINLTFTMANLGAGAVANNNPVLYPTEISYSELKTLLSTHESTADNQAAVNSLPGADPTNGAGFYLTSALAEALGLSFTGSSNGTVRLNSSDSYFYNGVPVSGEDDAIAALEHEISEEMGRIGGLGLNALGKSDYWGPIDLFRYSAPGQRDYSAGTDGKAAYFSINGTALLTQFNNPATTDPQNPSQGGDVADWNIGNTKQVAVQVPGGYDSFGATPTDERGVVSSTDLEVMNILGWTPIGATNVVPTVVVNVQNVWVIENAAIPASSLIASVSNPNGDSITEFAFWDSGSGNGYFAVNGVAQPDGQWITVSTSNLGSIQYVGGGLPGSEKLYVDVYDATTGTWSNFSSLTATTLQPTVLPVVNVQNVTVIENTPIPVVSLIASVSNPNGDSITGYAFWDAGGGNGYFTVNGMVEPDKQWIVVPTSDLGGAQYVGGTLPSMETLYVEAYDATLGTWSNYSSLTATTTAPLILPTVYVQNVSVAENASIPVSSMITFVSNPSGDSITTYAFWDGGSGNGHFTVNGAVQPDGQWIYVLANDLGSAQYVGGTSPGSEPLFVDVYDATIGAWSNYSSLTATTTLPHAPPIINVQNVSVTENASIPAPSLITSVSNPTGDSITTYAFWDSGGGNGYFAVNGASQPDNQWIEVDANNLGSIQYVGGYSPGSETLFVDAYDATIGSWSPDNYLTATTTAYVIPPLLGLTFDEQQAEAMYVAYFGRAGDPVGTQFWIGNLDTGQPIDALAMNFANQVESRNVYPFLASLTDDNDAARVQFIDSIYQNLFNRTPDTPGLNYWDAELQHDQQTLTGNALFHAIGGFILEVIRGAQNSAAGQDITSIENKVTVASYFTDQLTANNINYANNQPATIDAQAHSVVALTTSTAASVIIEEAAVNADILIDLGNQGASTVSVVGSVTGQTHPI